MKAVIWWLILFWGPILAYAVLFFRLAGSKAWQIIRQLKDNSSETLDIKRGEIVNFFWKPLTQVFPWWWILFCLMVVFYAPLILKVIFAIFAIITLFRVIHGYTLGSKSDLLAKMKERYGLSLIKTLIFFVFTTSAFLVFMSKRFPHVDLSPGNFFSGEWLKMNLLSLIIWAGVFVLFMSALFHRRIFWKALGIYVVLTIFLAVLGLRPGFMLEGTSHSTPFFMEIQGDNFLLDRMAKTEPTVIVYPFVPKNMNDYKKLFPVEQYDVVGVKWVGYFRFGRRNLLGQGIDQGTVFYGKYANLMRDPHAHPRSPVVGAKDGKLKRISSFKGPDNRQLKQTFFLMAEREGEAVIFPTNVPKIGFFYGDESEGFYSEETIYVWHFSKEDLK